MSRLVKSCYLLTYFARWHFHLKFSSQDIHNTKLNMITIIKDRSCRLIIGSIQGMTTDIFLSFQSWTNKSDFSFYGTFLDHPIEPN